ncbi:MAG: hypothetical protein ACOCUP_00385 [bacterium]
MARQIKQENNYQSRLLKLIPSEIVAAYHWAMAPQIFLLRKSFSTRRISKFSINLFYLFRTD